MKRFSERAGNRFVFIDTWAGKLTQTSSSTRSNYKSQSNSRQNCWEWHMIYPATKHIKIQHIFFSPAIKCGEFRVIQYSNELMEGDAWTKVIKFKKVSWSLIQETLRSEVLKINQVLLYSCSIKGMSAPSKHEFCIHSRKQGPIKLLPNNSRFLPTIFLVMTKRSLFWSGLRRHLSCLIASKQGQDFSQGKYSLTTRLMYLFCTEMNIKISQSSDIQFKKIHIASRNHLKTTVEQNLSACASFR